MELMKVNNYISKCKDKVQLVNISIIDKLNTIYKQMLDVDYHINGNVCEWELWFNENEEWYQIRIQLKDSAISLYLNNTKIVSTDMFPAGRSGEVDISEFMDWIIQNVNEDIRLMNENRYTDEIFSKIPSSCKTGIVVTPCIDVDSSVQGYQSELCESEIRAIKDFDEIEYRLIERPNPDMTFGDIYKAFAKAARECNWDEEDCETDKDIFLKFAKERHTAVLEGNDDITLEEWFNEYAIVHGMYYVVDLDRDIPIGINVCQDEEGYFLQVICNSWDYMDNAVRFYLVMVALEMPVLLPNAKQYKAILEGSKRIALIPKNNTCDNYALLYPANTFVTSYIKADEPHEMPFPYMINYEKNYNLKPREKYLFENN